MKRRFLIYLGVALLVGLYLYDRDTSTRTVMPATVLAVEARDDTAGPDRWYVTVDIGNQSTTLSPLAARPDVTEGDRICVTRIERPGQPDELRRSNAGVDC